MIVLYSSISLGPWRWFLYKLW